MNPNPSLPPAAPSAPPDSSPPRIYRVPPEAVQVYQTRALAQLLPVLSIALLAGLLVGYRGLPDTPFDYAVAGLMLVGLLVVGSVTILRSIQRTWQGYELVLAGDVLVQRQANRPEIQLARSEVLSIEEHPGRSLVLRGAEPGIRIQIPAGIEDYAGLRARLAGWAPVEVK